MLSSINPCKFYESEFTLNVFSQTNPTTGGSNGSVILQALNGRASYLYSKDLNNWQTSNTFSNLPKGIYSFYALDKFNKLAFVTVKLAENVNCGTYKNNTLQQVITANIQLENALNCTLNDFIP